MHRRVPVLAEQLADTVLTPFGMRQSNFAQPLPQVMMAQAALPHDAEGKPYAGGPYTYPELAAAGLWTTPGDLARFALGVQGAMPWSAAPRSRAWARSTSRTRAAN